jgi:hypothetical protein
MKITGSELRKIIKEEISRMNEGFRRKSSYNPYRQPVYQAPRLPTPDEVAMVSYPVPIDPRTEQKDVESIAVPLAIKRADDQFPGREWKIMKGMVRGTNYGSGMRWDREDRVRVFLIGSPVMSEPDLMAGDEEPMEGYDDTDIDLDR